MFLAITHPDRLRKKRNERTSSFAENKERKGRLKGRRFLSKVFQASRLHRFHAIWNVNTGGPGVSTPDPRPRNRKLQGAAAMTKVSRKASAVETYTIHYKRHHKELKQGFMGANTLYWTRISVFTRMSLVFSHFSSASVAVAWFVIAVGLDFQLPTYQVTHSPNPPNSRPFA